MQRCTRWAISQRPSSWRRTSRYCKPRTVSVPVDGWARWATAIVDAVAASPATVTRVEVIRWVDAAGGGQRRSGEGRLECGADAVVALAGRRAAVEVDAPVRCEAVEDDVDVPIVDGVGVAGDHVEDLVAVGHRQRDARLAVEADVAADRPVGRQRQARDEAAGPAVGQVVDGALEQAVRAALHGHEHGVAEAGRTPGVEGLVQRLPPAELDAVGVVDARVPVRRMRVQHVVAEVRGRVGEAALVEGVEVVGTTVAASAGSVADVDVDRDRVAGAPAGEREVAVDAAIRGEPGAAHVRRHRTAVQVVQFALDQRDPVLGDAQRRHVAPRLRSTLVEALRAGPPTPTVTVRDRSRRRRRGRRRNRVGGEALGGGAEAAGVDGLPVGRQGRRAAGRRAVGRIVMASLRSP